MSEMREFKVFRIINGIVIDHVPHWGAFNVLEILGLRGTDSMVTVGFGMGSSKMNKKDLVKVENRELTTQDINKIALVAPDATINRVRDNRVVEKFTVRLPDKIEGMVKCANSGCITHTEPAPAKFATVGRSPAQLRCHYCQYVSVGDEIELI